MALVSGSFGFYFVAVFHANLFRETPRTQLALSALNLARALVVVMATGFHN